jgi:hypothetical protein
VALRAMALSVAYLGLRTFMGEGQQARCGGTWSARNWRFLKEGVGVDLPYIRYNYVNIMRIVRMRSVQGRQLQLVHPADAAVGVHEQNISTE